MSAENRTRPDPTPFAVEESHATAWTGWLLFSAAVLTVVGGAEIVIGLAALFGPPREADDGLDNLFELGPGALAVVHVAFGLLVVAAATGLMLGRTWARATAVVLAFLGALANVLLIDAFPAWGVVASAFYVLTLYAVIVHGAELADARSRRVQEDTGARD